MMKPILNRPGLLLAGVIGVSWAATGATVVEYTFSTGLGAGTVAPLVTASPVIPVNVSYGGTVDVGDWQGNPVGQFTQWTGFTADAIEFTLTPGAGHTLALDYMSFAANSESVSGHGPSVWRIEVFRNEASVLALDLDVLSYNAWMIPVIDLSGLTFAPSESFRARIEGLGANGAERKAYFDNLVVEGHLVPEPGQFALVAGLGLVAFGAFRRVRRTL